jgi:hypothetical protein
MFFIFFPCRFKIDIDLSFGFGAELVAYGFEPGSERVSMIMLCVDIQIRAGVIRSVKELKGKRSGYDGTAFRLQSPEFTSLLS